MKLRVFLFPVLAPLWLLGFFMSQFGENKRTRRHSKSSELNFVLSIEAASWAVVFLQESTRAQHKK
jgi:hypothetical protein